MADTGEIIGGVVALGMGLAIADSLSRRRYRYGSRRRVKSRKYRRGYYYPNLLD